MTVATASWFHLRVKTIGRSAGRSVVAAAAYRLGERLHDEEVDQTHDYRRRHGVESAIVLAPLDAPAWAQDPQRLWNEANAAEKRINSTLAREAELALPANVSPEAREAITRAFAQELVDRYGVAVTAAVHGPSQAGDDRNHHAHIMYTTRTLGPDGLGPKTRVLDSRSTGPQEVIYLRGFASDLINKALADAGSDDRVDHRSFSERGIEQEPTEHLGPTASAIERRGDASERGKRNQEITARNDAHSELVAELAALDAQIREAEEERLDDIYGPSGEDDFATVHRSALQRAIEGERSLSESVTPPKAESASSDRVFDAVHQQAMQNAEADARRDAAENPEATGGRFARIRGWWDNMREYVASWREQVQEKAESYFHREDKTSPLESPKQEPHPEP